MHPAFSVLFFTTLSGAGYGLLMWTGALVLLPYLHGRAPTQHMVALLWAMLLGLGLVLTTGGLISSMFHLGKPGRAWRAFSQWRTSWLSREGVLAVLTALPMLGLLCISGWVFVTRSTGPLAGATVPALAATLVLLSIATVVCTAMIYASLKPIPAWRHPLVAPVYLTFAVFTGWMVLAGLVSWTGLDDTALGLIVLVTFALAFIAAVLKLVYWRSIDRSSLGATRGDAVGLPGREVSVFERPNTQDNYINREMGYVLARKHARPLRAISVLLFAVLPALLAWFAWAQPNGAAPILTAAALSALLGTLTERWLFFAQARHVVTLYY